MRWRKPLLNIWESEWLLRVVEWTAYTLAFAALIGLLLVIRLTVHHLFR